jgi:hypothetical protein
MVDNDIIRKFIPGFTMGIVRAIISHPFEMLKLKSQMNINVNKYNGLAKGIHFSIISNSFERGVQFFYFNDILKKTNNPILSSLCASLLSTTISLPYNIILLRKTLLEKSVNLDNKTLIKGGSLEFSRNLLGSTIFMYSYNRLKTEQYPIYMCAISSSIIVWGVTYPIDNIKNQIISKNNIVYTRAFLYKGIQYPIIRSFPSSIAGFYVYEYLNNYLNNKI